MLFKGNLSYTRWYVLYVKPRWEKKVFESLKVLSLKPFLPQTKTVRQWSDRKKIISIPLFPSYVFVNINSSLEFHKAVEVNGSCGYVRFGKEYACITEKEINQIKLMVNNESLINIKTDVQFPEVGKTKKIKSGPLSGLECEIIKVDNEHKILVRINSLKQNIIATLPLHSFKI